MKSVLLVALFVVIGSCSSLVEEWETWKLAYNKKYLSPDEEVKRYNVWIENKKYIEIHNKKKDKIGYTLEMNKFGDIVRQCDIINNIEPISIYIYIDYGRVY